MNAEDVRHLTSGDTITVAILRDFLLSALRHDAIVDGLTEVIARHIEEERSDASALATVLPELVAEVLDAASVEDWKALAELLVEGGRDALMARGGEE